MRVGEEVPVHVYKLPSPLKAVSLPPEAWMQVRAGSCPEGGLMVRWMPPAAGPRSGLSAQFPLRTHWAVRTMS